MDNELKWMIAAAAAAADTLKYIHPNKVDEYAAVAANDSYAIEWTYRLLLRFYNAHACGSNGDEEKERGGAREWGRERRKPSDGPFIVLILIQNTYQVLY